MIDSISFFSGFPIKQTVLLFLILPFCGEIAPGVQIPIFVSPFNVPLNSLMSDAILSTMLS